jgi:hypothetical protein
MHHPLWSSSHSPPASRMNWRWETAFLYHKKIRISLNVCCRLSSKNFESYCLSSNFVFCADVA